MNLRAAKAGPDDAETLISMDNVAIVALAAGQPDRAVPVLRDLADRRVRRPNPTDPDRLGLLAALGRGLMMQEQYADAEATFREVLAIRDRQAPDAWGHGQRAVGPRRGVAQAAEVRRGRAAPGRRL